MNLTLADMMSIEETKYIFESSSDSMIESSTEEELYRLTSNVEKLISFYKNQKTLNGVYTSEALQFGIENNYFSGIPFLSMERLCNIGDNDNLAPSDSLQLEASFLEKIKSKIGIIRDKILFKIKADTSDSISELTSAMGKLQKANADNFNPDKGTKLISANEIMANINVGNKLLDIAESTVSKKSSNTQVLKELSNIRDPHTKQKLFSISTKKNKVNITNNTTKKEALFDDSENAAKNKGYTKQSLSNIFSALRKFFNKILEFLKSWFFKIKDIFTNIFTKTNTESYENDSPSPDGDRDTSSSDISTALLAYTISRAIMMFLLVRFLGKTGIFSGLTIIAIDMHKIATNK